MTADRSRAARRRRILVIKHGALGDLIQALDAFQALRRHHAAAELVLMTTPPYAAFAQAIPWFVTCTCSARYVATRVSPARASSRVMGRSRWVPSAS